MRTLLPLLVVAIAVGLAGWRWHREQQRRSGLIAYAASAGWTFEARNDSYVTRWPVTPFTQGSEQSAHNVLTGVLHGRQFVAFDYTYVTTTTDAQGRSRREVHRYAVCALALPTYLPDLHVTPETWGSRLGHTLGMADIELESEDFNRRFRVRARNPKFASDVLTPRTMQRLLAAPPCAWQFVGTDIVSAAPGELAIPKILATTSTLDIVVAGIPDFVWRDNGVPVATPIMGLQS